MGKGDRRTRKGKIKAGSHGVARPKAKEVQKKRKEKAMSKDKS